MVLCLCNSSAAAADQCRVPQHTRAAPAAIHQILSNTITECSAKPADMAAAAALMGFRSNHP